MLPRFSDQTLIGARKADLYAGNAEPWVAKLDTIVHELYHIDPSQRGIRHLENADGTRSPRTHGPLFYEDVAEMVHAYLSSNPDPQLYEFLKYDFSELNDRFGAVVATTFKNFPSFPQRYMQPVDLPTSDPCVRVEPLKTQNQPRLYTEHDLHIRQFTGDRSRRLVVA